MSSGGIGGATINSNLASDLQALAAKKSLNDHLDCLSITKDEAKDGRWYVSSITERGSDPSKPLSDIANKKERPRGLPGIARPLRFLLSWLLYYVRRMDEGSIGRLKDLQAQNLADLAQFSWCRLSLISCRCPSIRTRTG